MEQGKIRNKIPLTKYVRSSITGRRAAQSFMTEAEIPDPATNSLSWIECSGKAAWKVFIAATVMLLPISKYLRLTQSKRSDTTKSLILVALK